MDLIKQLCKGGRISEQEKQGIVLCIPKTSAPTTPADYRSIALLNTDYKILARIIANKLRLTLSELLHPSQYWWCPAQQFFDAVETVRDAIAYVELTHAPLCILSLDIFATFDRISHAHIHLSDAQTLWI